MEEATYSFRVHTTVKPVTWTAVVAGYWNPAILTPNWIRERLFELPKETPVAIEISIDEPQPLRIRHDGLCVAVALDRITVSVERAEPGLLKRAADLLMTALKELPQTPVLAAGVNICFSSENLGEEPAYLRSEDFDEKFESDYRVVQRQIRRSFELLPGKINLQCRSESSRFFIDLNYECLSKESGSLSSWLERSLEFHEIGVKLLKALDVSVAEEVQ